jgi:protein-disulfide isomerase
MSIIKKNSLKFLKINLFSILIVFFVFSKIYLNASENRAILSIGNQEAKVTIKVFSSLTCPHCANFHNKIFKKLKKEFIDNNKVKYEHHGFPLDLAALNAEKILGCVESKDKKIKLLNELYKSQDIWASGSDINSINDKLFKISNNFGMNNDKNNSCLNDQNLEDEILNERINASKNYSIESTPTIFINEKRYKGEHNYQNIRNKILKLL